MDFDKLFNFVKAWNELTEDEKSAAKKLDAWYQDATKKRPAVFDPNPKRIYTKKRVCRRWKGSEDVRLLRWRSQGRLWTPIARDLKRSVLAVQHRYHRLKRADNV